MPTDNTPAAGTVADTSHGMSAEDAASKISSLLLDSDEDTPEADTEDHAADESDEDYDAEADEAEPTDEEDDAGEPEVDQPRDENGRFVSRTAKVKLDDGSEATIDDLIKGNLRQADYTRKTQELAAQRQRFQEQDSRIAQREQQLQQSLNATLLLLQQEMPVEPDVSMLQVDPIGFMQAKAEYEQKQRQIAQIARQQQQIRQSHEYRMQEYHREILSREGELLREARPELKDERKFEEFKQTVLRDAPAMFGLTRQELGSITDHRQLLIIADALAYRKAQAEKPKQQARVQAKVQNKPPLKAGVRTDPKAKSGQKRDAAWQQLKSTGTVAAGANVLAHLIK